MMKKLFFFGMIGAMALSFNACSSDEDALAVNPTFDGEAVKTQFTINVGQSSFATRMTAANVQADAVGTSRFLGMQDMKLFAYSAVPADGVTKTASFDLGSLATTDVTDTHSNQFYTLQIPVGTTNFLFYGKSVGTDAEANGKLTVATANELADVNYALTTRYTADFTTKAGEIATKLTRIAGATGWATATDPILSQLYTNFTATNGKIRAGYGAAVIRMVNDLKKAATELSTNNAEGSTLKTVADAILTAINNTDNDVSGYTTFPTEFKMPAGAAQLEWVAEPVPGYFQYKTAPDAFKTTTADVQKIAYPAELMYWASSDLRETPNEKTQTDYPDGVANWANNGNTLWGDWTVGAVKASTRAIAMKRNINYGVAGLHSTVEWTDGDYADNRAKVVSGVSEPSNDFTNETFAVTAESFTLTGILVGGQPASAKWNLLPAANTFDWVVYDNKLVADKNESYTLVLDNFNTGATQSDVLVALEFTNNLTHKVTKVTATGTEVVDEAADFYGVDGIIPAGGKFYLVGKLELSTAANWTEAYENDRINPTKRIFAQDRMTVAKFKFSTDALKNAYETIPDLQSVSMLFGLSVDIHWLDGLQFNNVPL